MTPREVSETLNTNYSQQIHLGLLVVHTEEKTLQCLTREHLSMYTEDCWLCMSNTLKQLRKRSYHLISHIRKENIQVRNKNVSNKGDHKGRMKSKIIEMS